MKTTLTTLLNSIKLLKSRSHRKDKLFPLSRIDSLLTYYAKINSLSLGRLERLTDRIRITHNLFTRVRTMRKHHGELYTIKWLKSSHVALQKYLAGDPLTSLRQLEPKVPLPRLINGCPACINKRDRQMMREGNTWICRFWLSQFSVYRVLSCTGPVSLSTILSPFSGSSGFLLECMNDALEWNPFKDFIRENNIVFHQPMEFLLSHKSSPSNTLSYRGLLTDWHNMKYGTWKLTKEGTPESPRIEYYNLVKYLTCLKKGGFNLIRFRSLLSNLDSFIQLLRVEGLSLNHKSNISGTGLSQWAFKQEAGGKIRVFALLDSITQSVLRPLHDLLFDILRVLPNDGTFNQDASVIRSAEKFQKYGISYSFDLSAATDRLPVLLTSRILESITGLEGFGDAWKTIMVDRDFSYSGAQKGSIGHQLREVYEGKDSGFRYSVGQPMGGLSSWAGLAITHHWILQLCSNRAYGPIRGLLFRPWEDRYEILGDDIVIFDEKLAKEYLVVMDLLGVEINASKSINGSRTTFEFAKRTVHLCKDISGLSPNQIVSSTSIGSRVIDAYGWIKKGLVKTHAHFGRLLSDNSHFSKGSGFRSLRSVGLPALSFLNLLLTDKVVELRLVLEAVVNPKFLDFDFERAKFDLPLQSLLRHCLECVRGMGTILSEQSEIRGAYPLNYPFSKFDDRREFSRDYESHIVAVILQESLVKARRLFREYESLLRMGGLALYKGKASPLLEAQATGFITDVVLGFSNIDVSDYMDETEDMLYRHAKYPCISLSTALENLELIESLIFKFTFKLEVSRSKYDRDTSPVLMLLRKSEGNILIPYWNDPVYL